MKRKFDIERSVVLGYIFFYLIERPELVSLQEECSSSIDGLTKVLMLRVPTAPRYKRNWRSCISTTPDLSRQLYQRWWRLKSLLKILTVKAYPA